MLYRKLQNSSCGLHFRILSKKPFVDSGWHDPLWCTRWVGGSWQRPVTICLLWYRQLQSGMDRGLFGVLDGWKEDGSSKDVQSVTYLLTNFCLGNPWVKNKICVFFSCCINISPFVTFVEYIPGISLFLFTQI